MKLSVKERLNLLLILPAEGNITNLKIIRQLREDCSFSEQDHDDFDIRTEDNMFKWEQDKEKDKEIEIGEKATDIIVSTLKRLDKEEKLTDGQIELWEKFID